MNMYTLAEQILCSLYEEAYVYLRGVESFSASEQTITATFCIPATERTRYTRELLDYVPTIERHMCVNQLGYILLGLLVEQEVGDYAKITPQLFAEAELAFRMWVLDEEYHHRKILHKDEEFQISMRIEDARISPLSLSIVSASFSGAVTGIIRFAARC